MTNSQEYHDQPDSHDELDAMLRQWHGINAQRAAASRDALMARLSFSRRLSTREWSVQTIARAALANRFLRAAASLTLLITLVALLLPMMHMPAAAAQREIMLPDGGRLEARDERGQRIGPCALAHTDVKINVTGPFTRVKVRQQFQNPYTTKIEAVYTFPLSNRAAVDSMSMTIGDRVVQAEMKERQQARQIYESARNHGYVASLLEQERPNIFTQSVANIEPGVDIIIEISYVEMLQSRDGEYSLAFPMVVAPRYIPGSPLQSQVWLPAELQPRCGSILLGPATFERMKVEMVGQIGNGQVSFDKHPLGPAPYLQRVFDAARPIQEPAPAYRGREDVQQLYRSNPSFDFNVIYADGSREFGQIAGDGLGHIAGLWFYFDPAMLAGLDATRQADQAVGTAVGTGYESNTTQVPDASRITPMPVRPPKRAGHDVSLSVSIDTGGPAIIDYRSDLHDIVCTDGPRYRDLGNKVNLALRNQRELPNRDFVLSWKTLDDQIQESTFAYIDPKPRDDASGGGGFFTVILAPPARVADDAAMPRELVFVLDTSGSMQGLPIEKAKVVMAKAIDAMRPRDTFNLITFSGDTHILWDSPRPNTRANRNEAQNFLASRHGNGGTEMMSAINAALAPSKSAAPNALTPEELANLPADGREVLLRATFDDIEANVRKNAIMEPALRVRQDLAIKLTSFQLPVEQIMQSPDLWLRGKWTTINGERILQIASAEVAPKNPASGGPMRIVMFLTDGQVGNDDAIIQAVRANAKTTRVFGFGIGDSPNRNLLDGMAQAGRGEVEYVNLQLNPDEAVQRFVTRIGTPVLTDIQLTFSDNLKVSDTIPPMDAVPDMFDVKPLIIHGRVQLPLPQGEGRGEGEAQDPKGILTITGNTGAGPYSRTIDLDLSPKPKNDADPNASDHAVIATLWARAKVDELQKHPDGATQQKVTALGEQFSIMTPYTSFVAVEKARLTIAGRSVLVPVPIELPEGQSWEGNFGGERNLSRQAMIDRVRRFGIDAAMREVYKAQEELQYDDAIGVLDAILVVDPSNQAGMALRDIIRSTMLYRDYADTTKEKDWSLSQLNVGAQRSMVAPAVEGRNLVQTGSMDYSLQRSPGGDGSSNELQFTGRVELPVNSSGREMWYGYQAAGGQVDFDGFVDATTINKGQTQNVRMYENPNLSFTTDSFAGVAVAAPVYRAADGSLFGATPVPTPVLGDIPLVDFSNAPGLDLNNAMSHVGQISVQGNYLTKDKEIRRKSGAVNFGVAVGSDSGIFGELARIPTNGNGGGGGGRGGSGNGGIFGDPRSEPKRLNRYDGSTPSAPPTADEITASIIDLVRELSTPEAWDDYGGDQASLRFENGRFIFTALKNEPQVLVVIEEARAFLVYLQTTIPGIKAAGVLDASPSRAFQRTDAIKIYDVQDILDDAMRFHGGNPAIHSNTEEAQSVADVIQENVDPECWVNSGGTTGSLKVFAGFMIIRNTRPNHSAIAKLLGQIRQAKAEYIPNIVTDPNDAKAIEIVIYDFRDLLGVVVSDVREELAVQVIDIITNNVDPEGWLSMGGDTSSVQEFAGRLVIKTTRKNHAEIVMLLNQLREIRKVPVAVVDSSVQSPKPEPASRESREQRLRRIIDQRLWEFVDELAPTPGVQGNSALSQTKSAIAVILSVRDLTDVSLTHIYEAGFTIGDIAKSQRVIAGSIIADKLDDLAKLECVRRIEPLEK